MHRYANALSMSKSLAALALTCYASLPHGIQLARNKLQREFQREVAAFQNIVRQVMEDQQRNRLRSSVSEYVR